MRSVSCFMILDSHIITYYELKCVYLFVSTNNNAQQRHSFGNIHKYLKCLKYVPMFTQNNSIKMNRIQRTMTTQSSKNMYSCWMVNDKHASKMRIISTIEHLNKVYWPITNAMRSFMLTAEKFIIQPLRLCGVNIHRISTTNSKWWMGKTVIFVFNSIFTTWIV